MTEDNKYSDTGSNFLRVALRELGLIGVERRLNRQEITELLEKVYKEHGYYVSQVKTEDKKACLVHKRICPFCQTIISENEDIVRCQSCKVTYHTECWSENGGCAVPGCGRSVADNSQSSDLMDDRKIELSEDDLIENYYTEYPGISSHTEASGYEDTFTEIKIYAKIGFWLVVVVFGAILFFSL